MLCCAKNRRCESSDVASPLDSTTRTTTSVEIWLKILAYIVTKKIFRNASLYLPEKLALLSLLKEIKLSPDRKRIKQSNIW